MPHDEELIKKNNCLKQVWKLDRSFQTGFKRGKEKAWKDMSAFERARLAYAQKHRGSVQSTGERKRRSSTLKAAWSRGGWQAIVIIGFIAFVGFAGANNWFRPRDPCSINSMMNSKSSELCNQLLASTSEARKPKPTATRGVPIGLTKPEITPTVPVVSFGGKVTPTPISISIPPYKPHMTITDNTVPMNIPSIISSIIAIIFFFWYLVRLRNRRKRAILAIEAIPHRAELKENEEELGHD